MSLKAKTTRYTPVGEVHERAADAEKWRKHSPLVLYEAESRGDQKDLWALNYVSDSIEALTGYPAEDFLGSQPSRYLYQMIHPGDRGRVGAEYGRGRSSLSGVSITYRIKHRNESYTWVEERSNFVRQDGETVVSLGSLAESHTPARTEQGANRTDKVFARLNSDVAIATGQDFTEHLCQHLAVLLSCRQVRLFSVTGDCQLECLVFVRDGLMQPRYCLGLPGSHFASLANRRHLVRKLSDRDHAPWPASDELEYLEAFRLEDRGGRWLGMLVVENEQPMHADESLARFLELYTERMVTEIQRLKADRQVEQDEARYRTFFDSSAQASIVVDLQGRILNRNRAAYSLFGAGGTSEALDLAAFLVSGETDGQEIQPAFLEFIGQARADKTQESQWRLRALAGSPRTMLVQSFRISGDADGEVMLSFTDISDRLNAEALLKDQHRITNLRQQRLRGLVDTANRLEGQGSIRDFLVATCASLTHSVGLAHVACYQPLTGFWYQAGTDSAPNVDLDEHRANLREAVESSNITQGGAQSQWCYLPLVIDGQAVASLALLGDDQIFDDPDFLPMLAQTLNLSLDNLMQRHHLSKQSMNDTLTGLGNRSQLHQWIQRRLEQQPGQPASLLLFDLNRFKEINDTLGHHFGDRVLCEIGPRIQQMLNWPTSEGIFRLGGDEFAVLLPDLQPHEALDIAESMAQCLHEPYQIDAMQLQIEASIGVAHYPHQGQDGNELLRCADVAMYVAKAATDAVVVFDHSLDAHTPHRIAVLSELEGAIAEGQVWVAYQPIVNASTGRVCGLEGLVRWQHPELGPLSPDDFIPLAEMGQGIRHITWFVLHQCLEQIAQWRKTDSDLHVAVNLSARVLLDHGLPSQIYQLLTQYQVPGSALVLELTEGTLLSDPVRAVTVINQLAELGVGVDVDDFGTGYSSLAYLKSLPIKALKIDKSFIADLLIDAQDRVIVESTITMAHSLGLKTVAEGVESEEIVEELARLGVDTLQGYYYSKPLEKSAMTQWMAEYHRSVK